MELIDKRGIPLTTKFKDLLIGDYYQDDDGNICIKTGYDRCIYYATELSGWRPGHDNLDESIIPLKATVTVER